MKIDLKQTLELVEALIARAKDAAPPADDFNAHSKWVDEALETPVGLMSSERAAEVLDALTKVEPPTYKSFNDAREIIGKVFANDNQWLEEDYGKYAKGLTEGRLNPDGIDSMLMTMLEGAPADKAEIIRSMHLIFGGLMMIPDQLIPPLTVANDLGPEAISNGLRCAGFFRNFDFTIGLSTAIDVPMADPLMKSIFGGASDSIETAAVVHEELTHSMQATRGVFNGFEKSLAFVPPSIIASTLIYYPFPTEPFLDFGVDVQSCNDSEMELLQERSTLAFKLSLELPSDTADLNKALGLPADVDPETTAAEMMGMDYDFCMKKLIATGLVSEDIERLLRQNVENAYLLHDANVCESEVDAKPYEGVSELKSLIPATFNNEEPVTRPPPQSSERAKLYERLVNEAKDRKAAILDLLKGKSMGIVVNPAVIENLDEIVRGVTSLASGGVAFLIGSVGSDVLMGNWAGLSLERLKNIPREYGALTVGSGVGNMTVNGLLKVAGKDFSRSFLAGVLKRGVPLFTALAALEIDKDGNADFSRMPQSMASVAAASTITYSVLSIVAGSEKGLSFLKVLRFISAVGKTTFLSAAVTSVADFTLIKLFEKISELMTDAKNLAAVHEGVRKILGQDTDLIDQLKNGKDIGLKVLALSEQNLISLKNDLETLRNAGAEAAKVIESSKMRRLSTDPIVYQGDDSSPCAGYADKDETVCERELRDVGIGHDWNTVYAQVEAYIDDRNTMIAEILIDRQNRLVAGE